MATREARTALVGPPTEGASSGASSADVAEAAQDTIAPAQTPDEGGGGDGADAHAESPVDPAVTLDDGRVVVLERLNGLHLLRMGKLITTMGMSAEQVGAEASAYVKTILCIDTIDGLPYQGPQTVKAMEWAIGQFGGADLLELSTRFLHLNVGKRLLEQQAGAAASEETGGAVDPVVTLEDGRVVELTRLNGLDLLRIGQLLTRLGMSVQQIGTEAHAYVKTLLSIATLDGAPQTRPATVSGMEGYLAQFSAPDLLELSSRFLELNVGKRLLEGDFRG